MWSFPPVDLPSTSDVAPDPLCKLGFSLPWNMPKVWRPHEKCHVATVSHSRRVFSCRMVSFDGGDTRPSPPSERTSSCGGLAMTRRSTVNVFGSRMDSNGYPEISAAATLPEMTLLAKQRSQIVNQLVLFFVSRPKQDL